MIKKNTDSQYRQWIPLLFSVLTLQLLSTVQVLANRRSATICTAGAPTLDRANRRFTVRCNETNYRGSTPSFCSQANIPANRGIEVFGWDSSDNVCTFSCRDALIPVPGANAIGSIGCTADGTRPTTAGDLAAVESGTSCTTAEAREGPRCIQMIQELERQHRHAPPIINATASNVCTAASPTRDRAHRLFSVGCTETNYRGSTPSFCSQSNMPTNRGLEFSGWDPTGKICKFSCQAALIPVVGPDRISSMGCSADGTTERTSGDLAAVESGTQCRTAEARAGAACTQLIQELERQGRRAPPLGNAANSNAHPAPPAVTAPPQVGAPTAAEAAAPQRDQAATAAAAARQDRLSRAEQSANYTKEADTTAAIAIRHQDIARTETAAAEADSRAAAAARARGNEADAQKFENSAADHRKNAGFENGYSNYDFARADNLDRQSTDAIKEDLAAERPGALAAASKDMQERRAAAGDGPCTSTRMTGIGDSGTACRSTRTTIDAIDMTDTITDKVGEVVSTYAGANAVAKVEKDPTKMQEYYGAAAELYDTQVGINTGQATIDTVAGALSFARNRVHNWHENTFKKAADAAAKADNTRGVYAGAGAKTAEKIGTNNGRALEAAGGSNEAERASRARIIAENEADSAAVRTLAGAAASEQSGYAGEALGRMMKSGIRALGQIGYLTTNALEATKMRKERDKYSCDGNKRKNDDGTCPAPEPETSSGDTGPNGEVINDPNGTSNGDARAPGGGIMPDGNMSVSKAVADDSEHKTDGLPPGGGVKEIDTPQGSKASGPEAGTFKEGNGGAPAGGGGGGAANVAGTGAAAEVSGGDPGSTSMAEEAKGGGYAAGEGGGRYGGGGAPGSANIGGGLPDVNELLAGLLPKKEDGPGNGIVQFAQRGLASAPASLLDAKTNIFERLHTTYLDKHKRGIVGIK